MKKLRSAIIGCGKMAHVHAQALRNIEAALQSAGSLLDLSLLPFLR